MFLMSVSQCSPQKAIKALPVLRNTFSFTPGSFMLPKVSPFEEPPSCQFSQEPVAGTRNSFKEKGNSEQDGQPQSHLHPISASDQHVILGKSFPHSVPQSP